MKSSSDVSISKLLFENINYDFFSFLLFFKKTVSFSTLRRPSGLLFFWLH